MTRGKAGVSAGTFQLALVGGSLGTAEELRPLRL